MNKRLQRANRRLKLIGQHTPTILATGSPIIATAATRDVPVPPNEPIGDNALWTKIKEEIGNGGGGLTRAGKNIVFQNGYNYDLSAFPISKNFRLPFYRIPGIGVLSDGTIIAISDCRTQPEDQIAIRPIIAISEDGGNTWERHALAPSIPVLNDYDRIMDAQIAVLPDDTIFIAASRWDGTSNNSNWTQHRNDPTFSTILFTSTDKGKTWTIDQDFAASIAGLEDLIGAGSSWLPGVGASAISTDQERLYFPIQYSPQQGKVAASMLIYDINAQTWTAAKTGIADVSECSIQINVYNNQDEIILLGRRDPNTNQKRAGYYRTDPLSTAAWSVMGWLNDKIPALNASSGCNGGFLKPDKTIGVMFATYTHNLDNSFTSPWFRDRIKLMAIIIGNKPARFIDLLTIEQDGGAYQGTTPYGGYSLLSGQNGNYFAVYEYQGSIAVMNISRLVNQIMEQNGGN